MADRITPIAPVWLSQLNCLPAVGVDERRYRETVRALGIPHVRRGQLVLVRVADWDAFMARASSAGTALPSDEDTPDAVLAAIGWRRRAG